MRRITDPAQVAELGTIMGIWAHPDDETFIMAGLMAAAVQNGQTVVCVTATKGEAGSRDEQKWPPEMLGELRAAELDRALDIVGVKHHYWLGYRDGGCHEVNDDEAAGKLLPLLENFQPDTIITFSPDGVTGHLDHIAVSRWSRIACQRFQSKPCNFYYGVDTSERYEQFMRPVDEQFDVYFNVERPCLVPEDDCDIVLSLPPDLAHLKCEMLKAMPSQTDAMLKAFGQDYMEQALSTEAFVRADRDLPWARPKKV